MMEVVASSPPTRPQPTALQKSYKAFDTSTSSPLHDSGSSNGGQTSGSFVILPKGAQLPDASPRFDLPPLELMNPPLPIQRRLSRPIQKPLPPLPRAPEAKTDQKPASSTPTAWAVPFRGFVKAVKWTRSDSNLKNRVSEAVGVVKSATTSRKPQLAQVENVDETGVSQNRLISLSKRKPPPASAGSPAPGPVFLVPHVQTPQLEIRPPTPSWMHPVAINPLEYSTARTVIGHSSLNSRASLDGVFHYPISPPLADVPVRRSVSEIGHGSFTYAPFSPDASYSTLGDTHYPPFAFEQHTPDHSLDALPPQQSADLVHRISNEEERPRLERKSTRSRLEGLKRVLSFKRLPSQSNPKSSVSGASQSAGDILSRHPPVPSIGRHRPYKSVDVDRSGMEMPEFGEERERPNKLRRHSVLVKSKSVSRERGDRNESPSSFRFRNTPKFVISPAASESSFLSTGLPTPSPPTDHPNHPYNPHRSGSNTTPPERSKSGRRLVKRKPSETNKSVLPSTLEVETPKSLEIPNPMESLVLPLPPLPDHPQLSLSPAPSDQAQIFLSPTSEEAPIFLPTAHEVFVLPTPDTPGLPLSAPPTAVPTMSRPLAKPPLPLPAHDYPPRRSSLEQSHAPPVPRAGAQHPLPPIPKPIPPPPDHVPPASLPPIPALTTSHSAPPLSMPPQRRQSLADPATSMSIAPPPSAMRELRPPMPHRPSIERRASRRRWTFNIAAEDAEDEVLVTELERLKSLGPIQLSGDGGEREGWDLARKALLSSREIILTERSYLNQLMRYMEDMPTDNNIPPLLIKHIPILASASQAFCNRLQEDPSAWGVSAAFVTVEAVLEKVLVDYCQVVGQIMLQCQQAGNKTPTSSGFGKHSALSKSKNSITSEFGRRLASKSSEKIGDEDKENRKEERSGSMPVSAWQGDGSKGKVPRSRSMPGKSAKHKSLPVQEKNFTSLAFTPLDGSASNTPGPSPTHKRGGSLAMGKARAITAADLAIAPPQRVTRYVMLYKDLLNGTPLTAPSRPLVQRALDGALRIAENCDKAQGDASLHLVKNKS